jgi:hypothetical protein
MNVHLSTPRSELIEKAYPQAAEQPLVYRIATDRSTASKGDERDCKMKCGGCFATGPRNRSAAESSFAREFEELLSGTEFAFTLLS